MEKIAEFQGRYRFLSNFWASPIKVTGVLYPTVEHYYQAQKCTVSDEGFKAILDCRTPGDAKRLARKYPIREDWDEVKIRIMTVGVYHKFVQNTRLGESLRGTRPLLLEEGNMWHDNFWGICRCERCKNKTGQNYLGRILMSVRDNLDY